MSKLTKKQLLSLNESIFNVVNSVENTETLDEGKIRNLLFRTLSRMKDKKDFGVFHWQSAQSMVDKYLGKRSEEGKEVLKKHSELSARARYTDKSDKAARKELADNMETLADDIDAGRKKQK